MGRIRVQCAKARAKPLLSLVIEHPTCQSPPPHLGKPSTLGRLPSHAQVSVLSGQRAYLSDTMDIKFTDLGLRPELVEGIQRLGFESPSPIQAETIPVALSGKDIVGLSQTGSGKTAAFGLPALNMIDIDRKETQVLVLCPTRELAVQVCEEINRLASCTYAASSRCPSTAAPRSTAKCVRCVTARTSSSALLVVSWTTCAARRCAPTRSNCASSTRLTACSTWASAKTWKSSSATCTEERQALFLLRNHESRRRRLDPQIQPRCPTNLDRAQVADR